MKKQEKKSASPNLKTTKSPKAKSPSKPKKEVEVKHKETALKDTDSEVLIEFRLHLFNLQDDLIANKSIGKLTKSEAVKVMERYITKKDTAVSGKLIPIK